MAGLVGVGVAVFLAGAFFNRLTKIVLPGGVELDFDSQASIAAEVAARVADGAKKAATDHDKTKTKRITKSALKIATFSSQADDKKSGIDQANYLTLKPEDIDKAVTIAFAMEPGISSEDRER